MTQATPETELRAMIGDLFMQLAIVRAENANLKTHPAYKQAEAKTNGLDTEEMPDADYRPKPG